MFVCLAVHDGQIRNREADDEQSIHSDDGNMACLQTCFDTHFPSVHFDLHRSALPFLPSADELRDRQVQVEDKDLLHVFDSIVFHGMEV